MKALLILLAVLVSLTASAQNWVRTAGPVEDDVHDLCIDSNGILYAMTTLGLNRSTDGGAHWTRPFVFPFPTDLHRIIIAANGNIVVYTGDGIYVSTGNDSIFTRQADIVIRDRMNFSIGSNGRLFAASRSINLTSDDHGITWRPISRIGINEQHVNVYAIAALHDTAYVQFNNQSGFYRSTDNGNSWSFLNGLLQYWYIKRLMILPNGSLLRIQGRADNMSHLFSYAHPTWNPIGFLEHEYKMFATDVMSDGSLLLSAPKGIFHIQKLAACSNVSDGFQKVDSGRSYMCVTRFIEDPKNKLYYAATLGAGVWKSASVLQSAGDVQAPPRFRVTPNPFTDRTTIHFTEATPSWAEIELRNILGAVVWKQGREFCPPGTTTLPIADHGLPPGNYLLVLRTNERTETQWVTIVK